MLAQQNTHASIVCENAASMLFLQLFFKLPLFVINWPAYRDYSPISALAPNIAMPSEPRAPRVINSRVCRSQSRRDEADEAAKRTGPTTPATRDACLVCSQWLRPRPAENSQTGYKRVGKLRHNSNGKQSSILYLLQQCWPLLTRIRWSIPLLSLRAGCCLLQLDSL